MSGTANLVRALLAKAERVVPFVPPSDEVVAHGARVEHLERLLAAIRRVEAEALACLRELVDG